MEVVFGSNEKEYMATLSGKQINDDRKPNHGKRQEISDYCYILSSKTETKASKVQICGFRWHGKYRVGKSLPNKDYEVRRL